MTSSLVLHSPLDYQVIQRRSREDGVVPVAGRCTIACDRVEVQLTGQDMTGVELDPCWLPATLDSATSTFQAPLVAPAGGWYALHVRAMAGASTAAELTIPHVGIGEVFVGAGQSNSTNCGGCGSNNNLDGRTRPLSGRVSSFDGASWRLADDPQPGVHDSQTDGSFWPAFGDAMVARYQVPIGVAATGHSGTSIRQWTTGDPLFEWTLQRLRQLGAHGFRALLWHQGENDADTGMSARSYADGLAAIIRDFRAQVGREFPFFVAHASYIPTPGPRISQEIRNAQQQLWQQQIALEGPDTDAMLGDLRDFAGTGIHFSKKGLKVHGEAWAGKVAAWLDPLLLEPDYSSSTP